jgi:hypothetical protein
MSAFSTARVSPETAKKVVYFCMGVPFVAFGLRMVKTSM